MANLYNGIKRDWTDYDVKDNETNIQDIKVALEAAVHRQLMSDVPMCLLSGGLDSYNFGCSQKICSKRIESGDTTDAWYPQLHSFSVGLEGSPDLAAAQIVADHIGTIHHHEIKSLFKKV
jgi:asparagine synthase (glutamine-hydrolysing)